MNTWIACHTSGGTGSASDLWLGRGKGGCEEERRRCLQASLTNMMAPWLSQRHHSPPVVAAVRVMAALYPAAQAQVHHVVHTCRAGKGQVHRECVKHVRQAGGNNCTTLSPTADMGARAHPPLDLCWRPTLPHQRLPLIAYTRAPASGSSSQERMEPGGPACTAQVGGVAS